MINDFPTLSESEIEAYEGCEIIAPLNGKGDIEAIVAQKIFELIGESDLPPWKQSWAAIKQINAINFVSKKPYTGSNAVILNIILGGIAKTPFYATANQIIKDLKGQIKEGAKSTPVVYYNFSYFVKPISQVPSGYNKVIGKSVKRKDKSVLITDKNYNTLALNQSEVEFFGLENNEYYVSSFIRYFNVFNLADTTGIDYEIPNKTQKNEFERLAIAEKIVAEFKDKPKIFEGKKEALYSPGKDVIEMPDMGLFTSREEYYSTLFHELIHSTLHESRLDRGREMKNKDKKAAYAFEELIAEMGSCILCGYAGIFENTHINQASYLKSWQERLKEAVKSDAEFLIYATKEAQKAADYITKDFDFSWLENMDSKDQNEDKVMSQAKAKALILKLKLKTKLA